MHQIDRPQRLTHQQSSVLWWLTAALVGTGCLWFARDDMVGAVSGGLAGALLLQTNYEIIPVRWIRILAYLRYLIAAGLVVLKVELLTGSYEYSVETYLDFQVQDKVALVVFLIAGLLLLIWQGRIGLLKSRQTATDRGSINESITESEIELAARSMLARHPVAHRFLKLAILLVAIVWIGFIVYQSFSHKGSYPVGEIQQIDSRTFCSAGYCRLLITTTMGQFRVEPANFKVGDDAELVFSPLHGRRFCVGAICETAAVHTASDALRKQLAQSDFCGPGDDMPKIGHWTSVDRGSASFCERGIE